MEFFDLYGASQLASTLMLDVLASIKVPRSQTAVMQLLQLYVQTGHFYWTSGTVERAKLARLAAKLEESFRISRDAPGRAYDRRGKRASVHLVVLDADSGVLPWVLVSTAGRGGLADPDTPQVGPVYDTRVRGQYLRWSHYELLHAPKAIKRKKLAKFKRADHGREREVSEERIETVHVTTWTWRIDPQRVREHEALLASLAKHRDAGGLQAAVAALAQMPLFGGVRGQVLKLHAEARKLGAKAGLVLDLPRLPFMRRLPIYADPPATLYSLANRTAPVTADPAPAVTAEVADTAGH